MQNDSIDLICVILNYKNKVLLLYEKLTVAYADRIKKLHNYANLIIARNLAS